MATQNFEQLAQENAELKAQIDELKAKLEATTKQLKKADVSLVMARKDLPAEAIALVKEKVAAGLPEKDAIEVALRQLVQDKEANTKPAKAEQQ